MIGFFMLHIFLVIGMKCQADNEIVTCPSISRTRYKEQRVFGTENCTEEWNKCFQEIRLTEITSAGQYAFLYASGCADQHSLKSFNISQSQFMNLCKEKGVGRCRHRHHNGHYGGTICCENFESDVLKSWMFDVFFGSSREMEYELNATIHFVQNEKKGKTDHSSIGSIPLAVGLPFLTVLLFISLAFLQFYHVNDGVVS